MNWEIANPAVIAVFSAGSVTIIFSARPLGKTEMNCLPPSDHVIKNNDAKPVDMKHKQYETKGYSG